MGAQRDCATYPLSPAGQRHRQAWNAEPRTWLASLHTVPAPGGRAQGPLGSHVGGSRGEAQSPGSSPRNTCRRAGFRDHALEFGMNPVSGQGKRWGLKSFSAAPSGLACFSRPFTWSCEGERASQKRASGDLILSSLHGMLTVQLEPQVLEGDHLPVCLSPEKSGKLRHRP